MKKKMKREKIMGGELVRGNESIELYVILMTYFHKRERLHIDETKKQYELYELYKNMNPRYSELVILSKNAKLRIATSDIIYSSSYNLFSTF